MAEYDLQWAAIERLPTFERLRSSLFDNNGDVGGTDNKGKRVIDVTKLGAQERHLFIEKLIKHIEHDNLLLLRKIKNRIDNVGVKLPTVEVRYKNLRVEAECEVVHGKPLPTLWNSLKSVLSVFTKLPGSKSSQTKISIINDVSGIIKPGRPEDNYYVQRIATPVAWSCQHVQITGEISYNGYKLEEFVPQKTSSYISQNDLHIHEMTVREIMDFSARCQGVGSRAGNFSLEILLKDDSVMDSLLIHNNDDDNNNNNNNNTCFWPNEEVMVVSEREKEAGVVPDPDIDTYMKAISVKGLKGTLQTEYILKFMSIAALASQILALDICADTLVGNAMRRGISGVQKKRLTTGEMIVGPTKALFMDEITNGLDSSTAFQLVTCLQQMAHITDATVLVSLLQPAPETFDLFDDLILMCPERKGIADFVQEVISRKDQAQYWYHMEEPYSYVSVDMFSRKFKESPYGKKLDEELSEPYDKSQSHKDALSFSVYSLSKWELFRACASRELLLMKRNSFIYIFKTTQLFVIACITMTVFLQTQMDIDVLHANYYMGALFYFLDILLVDGLPELAMTLQRLEALLPDHSSFHSALIFIIHVSFRGFSLPDSYFCHYCW
uniref:ABC-2 type transporter transmembrane domain-containing protein n=1 Tax=Quercus lobata TaxID=97700 RepID=A0A7N2L6W5_QUELO